MRREFEVGDIAMLVNPYGQSFEVKVTECIQDDDDSWWYEVTPTEWEPKGIVNTKVPQKALSRICLFEVDLSRGRRLNRQEG